MSINKIDRRKMLNRMTFQNLFKILNTVKYLRLKQIYFRLYYSLHKISIHPTEKSFQQHWRKSWLSPSMSYFTLNDLDKRTFLGETASINDPFIWNNPEYSKLWLYNLHYFNELNTSKAEINADILNQFINRWISENPPLQGIGWEAYPLSIRIVNLIKWYSQNKAHATEERVQNLSLQVNALFAQLEYHILGNHLFANAKALVFAGAFFSGRQAGVWLNKGLEILDEEIEEQFLADGGHFELSPMYHASLLWDLCDLINLADHATLDVLTKRRKVWEKKVKLGFQWLSQMVHPDGGISFFNDAAFDIAPTILDIKNYIEQLGLPIRLHPHNIFSTHWLKETGYCVVNLDENSKAILDVAKVGPDYQPGHAHADTLSFELSVCGQRFLVNSGTSEYGDGPLRQFQRGTKAHNTVNIDERDSSEVWAGFRVARRAYPEDLCILSKQSEISVTCSHNGYRRLPGRNIHTRNWVFTSNSLSIDDRLTGKFKRAEARFYFHPDIQIQFNDNMIHCSLLNGKIVTIEIQHALEMTVKKTDWYPYFGTKIQNCCLIIQFKDQLRTHLKW